MLDRLPRGTSLLLCRIDEPRNNDLRLVVIEATPGTEVVETELGPATKIGPNETSRAYEVIWYCYVAYSVRNESYFKRESGEQPGPPLGKRTGSAYVDYLAASTFADDGYPGPLNHWYLYTAWHCIDVVCPDPPEIRLLSPEETTLAIPL